MRIDLPPAKAVLAASIACWNKASIMVGAATNTLHRHTAAAQHGQVRHVVAEDVQQSDGQSFVVRHTGMVAQARDRRADRPNGEAS